MTREQVKSYKQFGPYKSFPNGDLETYAGVFHGEKHNVQFFFQNNRLVRIGVYLWEGKEAKAGISSWRKVYEILHKDYGAVATPQVHVDKKSARPGFDVLAIADAANTSVTTRTEIYPVKQPNDKRVSARFMANRPLGDYYAIAIFFDPK